MAAQMDFWSAPKPLPLPTPEPEISEAKPAHGLRPYQEEAVSNAIRELDDVRSTLIVMPTGSGKTKVMTEIARRRGQDKILVLAHRDELLQQARERFARDCGERVGLDKAEDFAADERIVVGSIQTVSMPARLERFSPQRFDTIMVDEAHHAQATTYRKVLDYFGNAKIVGVTATPDRADEKAMGQIFDSVAFLYEIENAINDGYLCDVRCTRIEIAGLDLSSVKTVAGDLNQGDLDKVMAIEEVLLGVADATIREAGDRRTLLFTTSVANADRLAEIMNRHREGCAMAVNGKTEIDERRGILKAHQVGDFQFLVNVGIATEGYDDPAISCVAIARPTKSRALYCMDRSTEVLTPNGWFPGSQLKEGAVIAAWNPENESVEWQAITGHVNRFLYPEEHMVAISTPSVDIRCTNTHRMVWRPRLKSGKARWQISRAGELAQHEDNWELPVAGSQSFPGVPLTDDEIAFLGWVQTDGTVNKCTNAVQIGQSTAYEQQCIEIERVLTGCGFKWRFSDVTTPTNFGERTKPQRIYRVSKGKPRATDKHLRGWGALEPWIGKASGLSAWNRLEDLDERQFAILLHAWHLGDGSKHANEGYVSRSYHLAISDGERAAWLQSMCVRRGWRCNIARQAGLWMVHCKHQSWRAVGGTTAADRSGWKTSPHAKGEMVWCVSVPFGAFISRRNGKVAVVGNTQMAGRGLRIFPGKADALLLDFCGNSGRHKLASALDVLGGRYTEEEEELAQELVKKSPGMRARDALDAAHMQAEREKQLAEEAAKRAAIKAKAIYSKRDVNPFGVFHMDISHERELADRFGGKVASDRQVEALQKWKIPVPNGCTSQMAHRLLDAAGARARANLASFNQLKTLQKYGVTDINVGFKTAGRVIDAIAANGWKPLPFARLDALLHGGGDF